jgi:hypothetical protein
MDEFTTEIKRREFLKKAGRFALYTPPTILALLHPGMHAIASGGNAKKKEKKRPPVYWEVDNFRKDREK